jgi:hypothetical protein
MWLLTNTLASKYQYKIESTFFVQIMKHVTTHQYIGL